MTSDEMRDFAQYLRQCTDAQVWGVYQKELNANRLDYVALAEIEMRNRAMFCPQ